MYELAMERLYSCVEIFGALHDRVNMSKRNVFAYYITDLTHKQVKRTDKNISLIKLII